MHLRRFVRGHQVRKEIFIRRFKAIEFEESFIYSCFLTLVLNTKTKNDSLRVLDGSHLDGVALSLCNIAHSSAGFGSWFRCSVGSVARCAKDGGMFDNGVEGVRGRLVVRDALH
jgi:hypothetical protein